MGRFANEIPTPENVHEVIAALKPEKREKWQAAAADEGRDFEQYVIRRIGQSVEKRRKKARRRHGEIRGGKTNNVIVESVEHVRCVRHDEAPRPSEGEMRAAAARWRAHSPVSPNTPPTIGQMLARFAMPPEIGSINFRDIAAQPASNAGNRSPSGASTHDSGSVHSATSSRGAVYGCGSARDDSSLPSPGPLVEHAESDLVSMEAIDVESPSHIDVVPPLQKDDMPPDTQRESLSQPECHPSISNINNNSTSAHSSNDLGCINSNSIELQVDDSAPSFQEAQRVSPPRFLQRLYHILARETPEPSWDIPSVDEKSLQALSNDPVLLPRRGQYRNHATRLDLRATSRTTTSPSASPHEHSDGQVVESDQLGGFSTQQLEHEVEVRKTKKGKKRKLEDEEAQIKGKVLKQEDGDLLCRYSFDSLPSERGSRPVQDCSADSFERGSASRKPLERESFENLYGGTHKRSIGQCFDKMWGDRARARASLVIEDRPDGGMDSVDADHFISRPEGAFDASPWKAESPRYSAESTVPPHSPLHLQGQVLEVRTQQDIVPIHEDAGVLPGSLFDEHVSDSGHRARLQEVGECFDLVPTSPTSTVFHTAANSPCVVTDDEFHDSVTVIPPQQRPEFLDSS